MPTDSTPDCFQSMINSLGVLMLLAERPMNSAELRRQIKERSKGRMDDSDLQITLYRLKRQGYIRLSKESVKKGHSHDHILLPKGEVLAAEAKAQYRETMDDFLSTIDKE